MNNTIGVITEQPFALIVNKHYGLNAFLIRLCHLSVESKILKITRRVDLTRVRLKNVAAGMND